MKIYLVTDEDIERLKTELARDPKHGYTGGSSTVLSDVERKAHEDAHRFYWYHVCRWIDKIKEPK